MATNEQKTEHRLDSQPVILEGETPGYVRDAYRLIEIKGFTADGDSDFRSPTTPYTLFGKLKKDEVKRLAENASNQAWEKITKSLIEYGMGVGADLIYVLERRISTNDPEIDSYAYSGTKTVMSELTGDDHRVSCISYGWRVSTHASVSVNAAFWKKKDEQKE